MPNGPTKDGEDVAVGEAEVAAANAAGVVAISLWEN